MGNQTYKCDTCGHEASAHQDRESNGDVAPCKVCWCEDFESEEADNSDSDEAVRLAWDVVPPGWGGPA